MHGSIATRSTAAIATIFTVLAVGAIVAGCSSLAVVRVEDLPPVGPGSPGGLRADAAFEWIARLDPDARSTGDAPRDVARSVPAGFAQSPSGRAVHAISDLGSVYRAGTVANTPRGSASFWAQALAHHAHARYAHVDVVIAGDYHGVVLSADGDARVYAVLTRVSRDSVIVVEAIYPDSAIADVDHAAVIAFLARGSR
ncbi:MAG: hypothetical protein EA382_13465 [Spirochaetaceae bacterium]|nr:MAG: hypothetical protein EA382_13465 [Spirochaetaceae bacterium]